MATATTTAARVSSSDRRQQILDVATELFARQGFEGTTTRQIAEMARVNEAIIFRHFPSKEDLYWAIIERKCQTVGRSKMIQDKLRSGHDDLEMFTSIAEAFLRRTRQDTNITRLLLFTALERHELSQSFFRKYVWETFETLAAFIRQRIEEGAFRDVDPMLAARGFVGMVVYHFQVQELFGGGKLRSFDPRDVAHTLAEIWLKGMQSDGAVRAKNGTRRAARNGAAESAGTGTKR